MKAADKTLDFISNKLRESRLNKHLTQSEVAKMADTDTNYYAKIERGEAMPSLKTLEKIIRALKVKSSDILPF
jgi:transcriptional regulator with XRE-family HTH domain